MNHSMEKRLEFLQDNIRNTLLSKDGYNLSIWCPFCKHSNKRKLKLAIHLEKCLYHCWLCDKKGSNVPFLLSKISKSLGEASKTLFKSKVKNSDFGININALLNK